MNNTIWLIVDVSRFSLTIKPLIKELSNNKNDNSLINIALEYCLTVSISETLSLPVVYRKDFYLEKEYYSKLKTICDNIVFSLFDRRYLNVFVNQEIKLLFTGNSLFLTTFNNF